MSSPLMYRRRLINQINTPEHHIVYIFGPSGFGKTILARQWMESQQLPTAWVEGFSTANATELFTVFIEEIQKKVPHLAKKLSLLQKTKKVSISDIEMFVEILEGDKTPFNIVIDNAEEIRRSHNDLSLAIVRKMPRHIKLVLVTTTSPRSDFIREAGIKRFAVVTPDQLAFNLEETTQLAHELFPDLSEREIQEIAQFTEGWPSTTHIVMSLLQMDSSLRKELSNLRLKGKKQFALEANRVLAKLDDNQRVLLENLCLLQTINPEEIFELTNNVDAVRELTTISQDSIIVTQTKLTPPEFKIHPLFRDTLLDNLRRNKGFNDQVEKTIQILLNKGEIRQATSILIEIGETFRLSEILSRQEFVQAIGTSIQDSIARSAVNELQDWLPVARFLAGQGEIGERVIKFYIELLGNNIKAAEIQLNELESYLGTQSSKMAASWHGDLLALKSMLSYSKGQLEDNWKFAIQAFEEKYKDKSDKNRHQVSFLQFALWGAVLVDDHNKVKKISEILDRLSERSQAPYRNSTIIAMRSLIAAQEGRLVEAQNYLITPQSPLTKVTVCGFFGPYGSRLAEAILEGEAGRIESAIKLLNENAELSISAGNYPVAIGSLGRAGYYYSLLRDSELALERIERARDLIIEKSLSHELNAVVDIWEIRVRHFMLDNERVRELLKRCKPSYFVNSFQAASSIAHDNLDNTRKLIESFDLEIPRQAITYYLFQAYIAKDSPAMQLKAISKAIEIGSKHGYFHHFLTQRSDIMQQYITLASESPTAFNERLARAAGEELNKMMTMKNSSGDPLTRREADILRHLATGLPLKEIASNLNISKNTIKTHLRNLYRKLGAEDRKDAVEKGKKLLKV
ncbi:MAG: hypothetical protein FGM47_03605 [Candidatus Nanopelagicaceae bacterium]|nr:hypothetical protein [Candidatus Nanopelagicaceae bacterium]